MIIVLIGTATSLSPKAPEKHTSPGTPQVDLGFIEVLQPPYEAIMKFVQVLEVTEMRKGHMHALFFPIILGLFLEA